jgi:hypothetical protein
MGMAGWVFGRIVDGGEIVAGISGDESHRVAVLEDAGRRACHIVTQAAMISSGSM